MQARFGVGTVLRSDEIEGDVDPSSACPFNPQTDGLIPYAFEIENTTADFAQTVRLHVYVDEPFQPDGEHPLGLAQNAPDQVVCDAWATFGQRTYGEEGVPIGGHSPGLVEPGSWTAGRGWIIVPNHFTPADPDGNGELLRTWAP